MGGSGLFGGGIWTLAQGQGCLGGGIGLVRGRAGLFGERDRASWREIRAVW